jgi:hypothetical protein
MAILLFILLRDNDFRSGAKTTLKEHFGGFSDISNLEHFITSNSNELNNELDNELNVEHFHNTSPKACPNDSIGIVIHKFKMNDNYNIDAIDDVKLTDYCTDSYLEHNFINIINNIWSQLDTKFYLKQIVTEDEIENLMHYYVSNPSEVFVGGGVDCDAAGGESIQTLNSTTSTITDTEKREYSEMDVHILKTLATLNKDEFEDDQLSKYTKVARSIFTRMTNKTLYESNSDIHIYLVPYIEFDNACIINGKGNRPLVVVSMYYKDPSCNLMKRTISDITSPHTKDLWLHKFISNSAALSKLKDKLVSIQNGTKTEELRATEQSLMKQIASSKADSVVTPEEIKKFKNNIFINTQKMHDIYEYDYYNDHKIKKFKMYKSKNKKTYDRDGSVTIETYDQLVDKEIKQIKSDKQAELTKFKKENKENQSKIDTYEKTFKNYQTELDKIRKKILATDNEAYSNSHKIKTLNKLIDTKNTEINSVKYFAEKVKPIININLLLLCLFIQPPSLTPTIPLKMTNNGTDINEILIKPILEGGLTADNSIKTSISTSKTNKSFTDITNVIDTISSIINVNQADSETGSEKGDKCSLDLFNNKKNIKLSSGKVIRNTEFQTKCNESTTFETMKLYKANDAIQSHLINELIDRTSPVISDEEKKKLKEFKKELADNCTLRDSLENPYIEYGPPTLGIGPITPSLNDLIKKQKCNNNYLNSFSDSYI